MQPYSYFLRNKITGQMYYGIQYGPKADPENFWKPGGYFSSSSLVHDLIEQHGVDSFEAEVRRLFKTSEEALEWETKFLTRIKAAETIIWLNRHNGNGAKFRPPTQHSEETKKKMRGPRGARGFKSEQTRQKLQESVSNRLKGKPISEEHKKNISLGGKGLKKPKGFGEALRQRLLTDHPMKGKKHSLETIEKCRQASAKENNPMFGKKHSPETRKKISDAIKKRNSEKKNLKELDNTVQPT